MSKGIFRYICKNQLLYLYHSEVSQFFLKGQYNPNPLLSLYSPFATVLVWMKWSPSKANWGYDPCKSHVWKKTRSHTHKWIHLLMHSVAKYSSRKWSLVGGGPLGWDLEGCSLASMASMGCTSFMYHTLPPCHFGLGANHRLMLWANKS